MSVTFPTLLNLPVLTVAPLRFALATLRAMAIEAVIVIFALVAAATVPMLWGNRTVVIISGSMEPNIGTGAAVVASPVSSSSVKRGDVLVFAVGTATLPRVHRVVKIETVKGVRTVTTRGDANPSDDADKIPLTNTAWRVSYAVPFVGYVIAFATQPLGTLTLVIVPLLVIGAGSVLEWYNKKRTRLTHVRP